MNSKKYQNVDYEVRDIRDLRELINSCAELYGESPAFLVKDEPGGKYRPISHREWNIDVTRSAPVLLTGG
ncbi:MAG: hypothetical protein ACOYJH_04025 [Anaerovoracaceae bacterium]|jgi:long-chain acyl-CoA synthetase